MNNKNQSQYSNMSQQTAEQSAVKTLEHLGYTYHGGAQWKPPLGKSAEPLLDRITELEAQLEAFKTERKDLISHMHTQALKIQQLADAKKDAERYQWIPVSERLPDEGMEVIVYTPPLNGEDEQYTFEKYEDECFVAHSNNYEHFCIVAKGGSDCAWIGPSENPKYTHWIPLPAAPKPLFGELVDKHFPTGIDAAIAEGKQA